MKVQTLFKLSLGVVLGAVVSLSLSGASSARAADVSQVGHEYKDIFTARLTGQEEVPAVDADTTGTMVLGVRDDEGLIRYRLQLKDGENVTAAHLHCGTVGADGPVVATLFDPGYAVDTGNSVLTGVIMAHDVMAHLQDCDPGIQTLAHLIQAMREGKIYVNVHTTDYPDGYLRGQVYWRMSYPTMPNSGNSTETSTERAASGNGTYILLSKYYLLPPNTLVVSGHRFAANEDVQVTVLGHTYLMHTDANGSFATDGIMIPLMNAGSDIAVQVVGMRSGASEQATLRVGTYYPIVTPSDWLMGRGDTFSLNGRHFGPNEDVLVTMDDESLMTLHSDTLGAVTGNLTASDESGMHTYVFTGAQTGATYQLRLHVR